MNRNSRLGGIKFRELDYSKSSPSEKQTNKTPLRSKADVLKLFADASDVPEKENSSDNICTVEKNDSDDVTVQDVNFEDPFEDESKTERANVEANNVATSSIVKQETKPKIDIVVKEKPKIQSNVVGTSTARKENTDLKRQQTFSQPSQSSPVADGKKVYNVMVGKISTRKHKQWESDGILEVSGKSAVLKDIDGKFMGRTTVKPEAIEEGFRLCIGGKEIEIVELASQEDIDARQSSNEGNRKTESVEPPEKKAKLSKGFVPVKSGTKK